MDRPAYYKRTESPYQDRRSSEVTSPQLVLNILRSKTDYPNDREVENTTPTLSDPSTKRLSSEENKYSVNPKDPIITRTFSGRSNSNSIEVTLIYNDNDL